MGEITGWLAGISVVTKIPPGTVQKGGLAGWLGECAHECEWWRRSSRRGRQQPPPRATTMAGTSSRMANSQSDTEIRNN